MKRFVDKAIVLRRVNYGEKDRVVTLLCQNSGKVTVFAKGVRAQKSKLSGGIELLSISEVVIIDSKSELKILASANVEAHYGNIVKNLDKTSRVFEVLKLITKLVEDGTGQDYFHVLVVYLASLDDESNDQIIVEIWFNMHLLEISGVLADIVVEQDLYVQDSYSFDFDSHYFVGSSSGVISQNDIKLLRLLKDSKKPLRLSTELPNPGVLLELTRNLILSSLQ